MQRAILFASSLRVAKIKAILPISLIPFVLAASGTTWAADASVFDVRKTLPLEDGEVAYRDFYINAGSEIGLKRGTYVTVVRQVPVHDSVKNKAQATLTVPIAKIHIIHVEPRLSVARLHSDIGNDERVGVEYEAVMIGDQLDLSTLSAEAPKSGGGGKKRGRAPSAESAAAPSAGDAVAVPPAAIPPSTERAPVTPSNPDKTPQSMPDMVKVPLPGGAAAVDAVDAPIQVSHL